MLNRIENLPESVDGFCATGMVSKEDYERTFEPLIDGARDQGRRLRLLYELGPGFEGLTPGAAWEDAKLGVRAARLFDGCAIVSDFAWIRDFAKLAGIVMPCPVRSFANDKRDDAIEWLRSLPEGPAISHRLLPDTGVIVVEVKDALRAQDFDALSLTADTWIEAHGALHGIVVHARAFPGWENFASFLRHVRFVRGHHQKVQRVAFAADGPLASLVPQLAAHFVEAEMKRFAYDELAQATEWAAGT